MDPRNIHHRYAPDAAVKYDVESSIIDATNPRWVAGSNILTSKGLCERRPGFPAGIETTSTVFTNIQRIYGWRKWGGPYFVLVNEITATQSKVYFIVVGNPDYSNFTLLYTDNSTKPFDFATYNNVLYFGNGSVNRKWNGDVISLTYKWGVDGPTAQPSIALATPALGLAATQGYHYVYCYGTLFGHISSPSPVSLSTGVFAATSGSRVTVQYSTDTQVNQVFLYRTTDGGGEGGPFFRLPGEATIDNNTAGGTAVIEDVWADEGLLAEVAPPFFANDPPPPMRGITSYASRLTGFNKSSLFFSNNEEQTTGVAEESFAPTNKFSFGLETTALQEVNEGLLVHCGGSRIHKVTGDSLDTFRQDKMVDRMGTRNNAATATVGKSAMWLDSANLLRVSDGYSQQEFGYDIRPDIQTIDQSKAQMAVHLDGTHQWVLLLDGAAGKIRVYDLDREMWMTPWDIGGTAIASVETGPGVFKLLLAHTSGKILAADYDTYNDNGTPYSASQTLSLTNITSDDVPGQLGLTEYVVLEHNGVVPSQVLALVDEDPSVGTYVDITANLEVPPLRKTVTTGLVEGWYYYRDIPGRRMSFKVVWPTEDQNFKLYGFDVAGSTQQRGSG